MRGQTGEAGSKGRGRQGTSCYQDGGGVLGFLLGNSKRSSILIQHARFEDMFSLSQPT